MGLKNSYMFNLKGFTEILNAFTELLQTVLAPSQ